MENEYGITISNKYSLFLSGDEDPLELLNKQQLQVKSGTKKKTKNKESESKANQGSQSGSPLVLPKRSLEKVDQFASPTDGNESSLISGPGEGQGDYTRPGRQTRDRPRGQGGPARDRDKVRDNRGSGFYRRGSGDSYTGEQKHAGSGRGSQRNFAENQTDGSEPSKHNENFGRGRTDRGGFGFFERAPRPERYRARGGYRSDDSRFGDQSQGHFGDRRPRRGGFGGFRGRRMGRGGFGEHSDRDGFENGAETTEDGFDRSDLQHGFSEKEETSNGFSTERHERGGFAMRCSGSRGRGGRGRGQMGYNRPRFQDFPTNNEGRIEMKDKNPDNSIKESVQPLSASEESRQPPEKLTPGSEVGDAGNTTWAEQLDAADHAEKAHDETSKKLEESADATKEETSVMTLDEWKAIEDAKRAKADFNIRKPGEGYSGDPQWKKMFVLTKKEKSEEADEEDQDEGDHHITKPRNTLPIEIHFADDSRRGRGRSMGRGMRGSRGRTDRFSQDSYREPPSSESSRGFGGQVEQRMFTRARGSGARRERAPNFEDEKDFPSLDKAAAAVQS